MFNRTQGKNYEHLYFYSLHQQLICKGSDNVLFHKNALKDDEHKTK
jgi:hypothetical protein